MREPSLTGPLTTKGLFVQQADGKPVAACESPALARFIADSLNQRSGMIRCMHLYRGELESRECPLESPAYQDLLSVLATIEGKAPA